MRVDTRLRSGSLNYGLLVVLLRLNDMLRLRCVPMKRLLSLLGFRFLFGLFLRLNGLLGLLEDRFSVLSLGFRLLTCFGWLFLVF